MGDPKLHKHFGHIFRLIHNGIDRYFTNHNLDSFGVKLTMAQCAVMHYLYDHKETDVFQKDIENAFQISGATASNTLKGMEKQGVITRTPMPEDGRKKKIALTERGRQFHERAISNMEELERTLIKGMTEEEVTTYRRLLLKSVENLDEITGMLSDEKENKKGFKK
ncbi:MAG: MarR family transcriptional regulator [Lachnospiraceae bacterium]|nr:MarR family transcriptional regulator [Lachnospiraceae bacterium]